MVVLENLSQLAVAAQRARKVKNLRTRIIDFGVYDVSGDSGTVYRVECKKMEDGTKLVWCSCEEKYPRKPGQVCYHIVPAVGAHMLLAIAQRSVILAYEKE